MTDKQPALRPYGADVDAFISALQREEQRVDSHELVRRMTGATGQPATMWGPTIIGFGTHHYRYASGHEGDMCRLGFSPRSANLVLYVGGFPEFEELLAKLGKYKRSKACLYLNKLADVDLGVLEEIARRTFKATEDVEQCLAC